MAARFDPMLAVTTSDVEPLPHQIKAVYGELLPRTPLRFLLADDPGAGKTIMARLYIKELMLRGDIARCLVVAPGSLVEQWQEELHDKFDLRFELLSCSLVDATLGEDVFDRYPLLIARMDMLSRSDDLKAAIEATSYDLIVVDEAHRMSAHYYGSELKLTKRYELGRLLGGVARHLLLMTAPHAGKEEDFQAFMALLDADRFEGRFRDGVHSADTDGLMRRMVKEDLLTLRGQAAVPGAGRRDRDVRAVARGARPVRRRDRLRARGTEPRRRAQAGRRVTPRQHRRIRVDRAAAPARVQPGGNPALAGASSPTPGEPPAGGALTGHSSPLEQRLAGLLGRDTAVTEDDLDDLTGEEREELEEQVLDAASAATTIAELDKELAVLRDLEELATRVRHLGTDEKWTEFRTLLLDEESMYDVDGNRRKIIIFTEHRDTLNYLLDQIRGLLGRDDPRRR